MYLISCAVFDQVRLMAKCVSEAEASMPSRPTPTSSFLSPAAIQPFAGEQRAPSPFAGQPWSVLQPRACSPMHKVEQRSLMRSASRAGDPTSQEHLACEFLSATISQSISPERLASELHELDTLRKLASVCSPAGAAAVSTPRELGQLFADAGYEVDVPRLAGNDGGAAYDEVISVLLQARFASFSTGQRRRQPHAGLQRASSISFQQLEPRERPVVRPVRLSTRASQMSSHGRSQSMSAADNLPAYGTDCAELGQQLMESGSECRLSQQSSESGSLVAVPPASHLQTANHLIRLADGACLVLGECLGRGRGGAVFRAMNQKTGEILAVKRVVLDGYWGEDAQRLEHEASLLQKLQSPHIVRYRGFAHDDQFLSIATDYIEGGSLLQLIRRFGTLSESLAALFTSQIVDGLVFLHSQDVVHCDLKCANILVAKDGQIKLADFGISLLLEGHTSVHAEVQGTPNWLAPEVISLRGTSTASDIWSLGCTILEMLQGKPPYARHNAMSAMYAIVEQGCPPFPADLSFELTELLKQCFQRDPHIRPTAAMLKGYPWLQDTDELSATQAIHEHSCEYPQQESKVQKTSLGSKVSLEEDLLDSQSYAPTLIGRANSEELLRHFEKDSGPEALAQHCLARIAFIKKQSCQFCGGNVKRAVRCHTCFCFGHRKCLDRAPRCEPVAPSAWHGYEAAETTHRHQRNCRLQLRRKSSNRVLVDCRMM